MNKNSVDFYKLPACKCGNQNEKEILINFERFSNKKFEIFCIKDECQKPHKN